MTTVDDLKMPANMLMMPGAFAEWIEGGQRIRITVVQVTPEQAAAWLVAHDNYRKLRSVRAERYGADMADDNWRLTGDAIRFVNGELADGQHRLSGCVERGVPFWTVLVEIEPSAIPMIDKGFARTNSDELARLGVENAQLAAALAMNVLALRAGRIADKSHFQQVTPSSAVERFVHDNLDCVTECAAIGKKVYKDTRLRPAACGALAFVLLEHDPDNARQFFDSLATGANLDVDDPIFVLRRWITNKTYLKVRYSEEEFFGVAIKAWNAWRRGEGVKVLRFAPTGKGASRDKLPEPI